MTVSSLWLLFGTAAILAAVLNLSNFNNPKMANLFRYFSLSFTALTACGFYWQETSYVLKEDWSALMDIMPSVSKLLWICVLCSILINAITLFKKNE